jgi:hypothetical protein
MPSTTSLLVRLAAAAATAWLAIAGWTRDAEPAAGRSRSSWFEPPELQPCGCK